MTGTKAQVLSARGTGSTSEISPDRARTVAALVVVVVGSLSLLGAFAPDPVGSITYVVSLFASTIAVMLVARHLHRQVRAWLLVGVGLALWSLAGLLVTLDLSGVPGLVISVLYAVGYVPVVLGFADMADPQVHRRRLTSAVDGVILFLSLYAVLWLLVVEQAAYHSSYGMLDRAFQSLYPAGDLAILMLAVRVFAGHTVHRPVGVLLMVGALLSAGADVGLLVAYLVNPDGSYPVTDFVYLVGLGCFAVAGVLNLLPAPPPVNAGARTGISLPLVVAVSTLLPALVLGGIVWFTDREVSLGPVAAWLFLAAIAAVARNFAGARELERAHQHSLWLASHDHDTDLLRRATFLHEVSEGSLRDRSGTMIVVEVGGLHSLADRRGHDLVDHLIDAVVARIVNVAGEGAVIARLAHDQFAVFLRSGASGRGRQVAGGLQGALIEPVLVREEYVQLDVAIGVAQADGAVIDALAGVRRATEAMRYARRLGPGHIAFDAELTGIVAPTHGGSVARTIAPA